MSENSEKKRDDWSPVHTRLRWEIVILSLGVFLFGFGAIEPAPNSILPFKLTKTDNHVMVVVITILFFVQFGNFVFRTRREVNEMAGTADWPVDIGKRLDLAHSSMVTLLATVSAEQLLHIVYRVNGALHNQHEVERTVFPDFEAEFNTLKNAIDNFTTLIDQSAKSTRSMEESHIHDDWLILKQTIEFLHEQINSSEFMLRRQVDLINDTRINLETSSLGAIQAAKDELNKLESFFEGGSLKAATDEAAATLASVLKDVRRERRKLYAERKEAFFDRSLFPVWIPGAFSVVLMVLSIPAICMSFPIFWHDYLVPTWHTDISYILSSF